MRYARIKIAKSVESKLTHYIYRFKNIASETEIEDYINHQDPVVEIDELNAEYYTKTFDNFTLSRNDYPKNMEGFVELSTPFEIFFPSSKITLNLKHDIMSSAQEKISIHLGTSNIITKVVFSKLNDEGKYEIFDTITDTEKIIDIIRIKNYSSFYIKKELIPYNKVTMYMSIQVVEHIDVHAHGIFDPKISTIEGKDFTLFYQAKENTKNIYEYRVISKDRQGRLSHLSNAGSKEVSEPPEKVTQVLEVSDDYYLVEKPTWKVIETTKCSEEIKVDKDDICSNIIKTIPSYEIHTDDSILVTDGIRYLKIPNIWHKEKRYLFQREKRVFRIKNRLGNISSEYSDPIIFNGSKEVFTDKMIIYRKNVTGLEEDVQNAALSATDKDVDILKIYIRQGGIYYNDFVNNGMNKDIEHLISVIALDSRYPILTIKDNCLYSNRYNYTVYLYDEKGNVSEPIVIVA